MKALSFELNGRASYGLMIDGGIREAGDDFRNRYPTLRSVLAGGALSELPQSLADDVLAVDGFRYLPLIPNPDKVICVGVNYREHVEEMGRDMPAQPTLFVRFAGSIVGHDEPLIRTRVSEQFDFEGELAIVIGRCARHVPRQEAYDCIAGYACFMDGTVRDWQRHTTQFTPGKNFYRSGALGPWLLTVDDMPNPESLSLTTRVNGRVMQEGKVADLIFDIPALIEYCSTFTELLPGDIISTGTPAGVGAARTPPIWLREGDRVEVDIGPVGCLQNTVCDE